MPARVMGSEETIAITRKAPGASGSRPTVVFSSPQAGEQPGSGASPACASHFWFLASISAIAR
jgi:hypothetical protein